MKARATGLALAAALLAAAPARAEDAPRRIVSIDVCTDQLALLLVPRARIKSVTFLAADPATSAMAEEAKRLHLNHGLAEEILPLKPDIVLAGTYAARYSRALLKRLGHRVVEMPLGDSIDDVAHHLRFIARALGATARGEQLIAGFESRLRALPPPGPGPRPVAVLFESSGVTSGEHSLPGAVMRAAGFENLASRLGIRGVSRISMEVVVRTEPDVLIRGHLEPHHPSLAAATLRHPALARTVANGAMVDIPDGWWSCATPHIIKAVEKLAAVRARLAQRKGGT